jgi:YD repeat-containing protein
VTSETAHLDANTPVTTPYTYNGFGKVLTMTDAFGHVTTNTYDTHGNLLTVTTPAPNANTAASMTQFAYDSAGQLTQITDPQLIQNRWAEPESMFACGLNSNTVLNRQLDEVMCLASRQPCEQIVALLCLKQPR